MNTTRTLGEIDFGPDAVIDLDAYVLAFLDEHLRGITPEPHPAPVRIFVMGAPLRNEGSSDCQLANRTAPRAPALSLRRACVVSDMQQ